MPWIGLLTARFEGECIPTLPRMEKVTVLGNTRKPLILLAFFIIFTLLPRIYIYKKYMGYREYIEKSVILVNTVTPAVAGGQQKTKGRVQKWQEDTSSLTASASLN